MIMLIVASYILLIVTGYIPSQHRIDGPALAFIALAVFCVFLLMNPVVFERLKVFEVSGFKLEMLEMVKEKQIEHESKLDDISLILPLLLPQKEQRHLLNLAAQRTTRYIGNHSLRSELRRLRSVGLIESRPDLHISNIEDGKHIDLAKYVALKPLGELWVGRIREVVGDQDEKNSEY